MKFTKEQQDYIKHCVEHVELLTGGRGNSKTKAVIEDMQQEIDRLNNEIMQYDKCLTEMTDDNKRLNNIINELEEWVKKRIDNVKYNDYDNVLDKLKELKEDNI